MKKNKNQNEMFEVIMPFPGNSFDEHMLFDDCPLCQELKRKMEKGEVVEKPLVWVNPDFPNPFPFGARD